MGDSILRGSEANWAKFSNYLTDAFKTQFGTQSQLFQQLTSTLTASLQNPHGFDASTLSALRGNAADSTARQFQNASQAIGNTSAARGDMGSEVQSGISSQIRGMLSGESAGGLAEELSGIQLKDAELKDANRWKAIGRLENVPETENPNPLAGNANNAASTTGALGSEYLNTDESGYL